MLCISLLLWFRPVLVCSWKHPYLQNMRSLSQGTRSTFFGCRGRRVQGPALEGCGGVFFEGTLFQLALKGKHKEIQIKLFGVRIPLTSHTIDASDCKWEVGIGFLFFVCLEPNNKYSQPMLMLASQKPHMYPVCPFFTCFGCQYQTVKLCNGKGFGSVLTIHDRQGGSTISI